MYLFNFAEDYVTSTVLDKEGNFLKRNRTEEEDRGQLA